MDPNKSIETANIVIKFTENFVLHDVLLEKYTREDREIALALKQQKCVFIPSDYLTRQIIKALVHYRKSHKREMLLRFGFIPLKDIK